MDDKALAVVELHTGLYAADTGLPMAPPRLHQSIATVLVNRSPLHAWHKAFVPQIKEYCEVTTRGQIAHALLLGGDRIHTIEAIDWRTNAAKSERDAAIAAGKLPILSHKLADAYDLKAQVITELGKRNIFLGGQNEVVAIWQSPTGIWCEGQLDHFIMDSGTIYDFKFCASAAKKVCENKFIEYGYDIQHAAYVQAVETIFPPLAGRVTMKYIFVENDPPNAIRVMPVGGTMKTSGQWRWGKACEVWADCLARYGPKTPWPAYPDDNEPAECPAWALNAQIADVHLEEGGNL